jgi:chemotaxis protein MotA
MMSLLFKLAGLAGLVGCLLVVFYFESTSTGQGIMRVLHWPAILLTGVGPLSLVFVACDAFAIFRAMGLVLGRSGRARQKRYEKEALLLQRLSKTFYTDGPQVFEQVRSKGLSVFVARMIERLQVRMPFGDIRDLLEHERDRRQVRLVQALQVCHQGVKLTPSVGMLGTIMGMTQLLSSLEDPSQLGSHMSLALLTTFFGLFFSLTLWTPMHAKIERILDAEMDGYNMAVRWLELMELKKPANYFGDSQELPRPKKSDAEKAA